MPATTTPLTPQGALPADQIDFVDLYRRWEHNNWSAMDLDFSQDKLDWNEKFDDFMRKAARWIYSMFFFGEDEVADNLSPYIDAAPLEEQKYFLTTQQVDEARHAIFFSRFFNEVIGVEREDLRRVAGGHPARADLRPAQGLRALDRVADELRRDRSLPKLAQAITLYHLIVEGTLAQTGQHFIADYLARMDVLPGFREGMVNVAKDEQRHIAFGVKMLADFNRQDDEVRPAMREILQEVLPYTIGVFRPPERRRALRDRLRRDAAEHRRHRPATARHSAQRRRHPVARPERRAAVPGRGHHLRRARRPFVRDDARRASSPAAPSRSRTTRRRWNISLT